jgi:hypothetical protein
MAFEWLIRPAWEGFARVLLQKNPKACWQSAQSSRRDRGFILFIVITLLLAIAVLAFSLSYFKSGAVTQLAKTIDQNRLAMLAQAANNEILAMTYSQANESPSSDVFRRFRQVFSAGTVPPNPIELLPSGFVPQAARDLAMQTGYRVRFNCRAQLVVFEKSPLKTSIGFRGYLEITSRAYLEHDPTCGCSICDTFSTNTCSM